MKAQHLAVLAVCFGDNGEPLAAQANEHELMNMRTELEIATLGQQNRQTHRNTNTHTIKKINTHLLRDSNTAVYVMIVQEPEFTLP